MSKDQRGLTDYIGMLQRKQTPEEQESMTRCVARIRNFMRDKKIVFITAKAPRP